MEKMVVLITGCSSGLGLALAQHLVSTKNYRLVLTARSHSIDQLKSNFPQNEDLLILPLDITVSDEARRVVSAIIEKWKRVDAIVNNAGVCYRGVIEHMDDQSEMQQLLTNYLGPMNLIRAVLPIMREQSSGRILNISSVSGMVSMPTMGSYSASKHALEGATESLWYEAKPYGIQVTLIEPGFIRSDSYQHVINSRKAQLSQDLKGPHSEYYASMTPFIERLMGLSISSPHDIAKKIEKCLQSSSPPLRLRVTLDAQLFFLLRSWLPARFFHEIMFLLLPGSLRWGGKAKVKRKQRAHSPEKFPQVPPPV